MAKDGPATPSLSERLRQKTDAEREAIEVSMLDALRRHGESMNAALSDAVSSIENDMEQRFARLQAKLNKAERRQMRAPLWSALASIGIVLFGLLSMWGASWWLRANLVSERTRLAEIQLRIASESNALEKLIEQTGGVRVENYGSAGTFVELPEGMDTTRVYRCREEQVPCLKLPVVPTIPMPRPKPDGV